MAKIEELQEIAQLLETQKINAFDSIPGKHLDQSLYKKFYKKLLAGEFKTDDEALLELYGTSKKRANYFKLKSRLYSRLLNSLFLFDLNESKANTFGKAYLEAYKRYSCVKLLLGSFARNSAISLSENLIKKTIKFGFTDISINLARILKVHFSTICYNKRKFNQFNDILNQQNKVFQFELLAEDYYCSISKNFTRSIEQNPEIIKIAETYSNELIEILEKSKTYKIALYSYSVIIITHELKQDHSGVIKWSEEALSYFNPNLLSSSANFTFRFKIIDAFIHQGYHQKALDKLYELELITSTKSMNWFHVKSFQFIVNCRLGSFSYAEKTLDNVYKNKHLSRMPPQIQERWRIHQAFIQYLVSINKLEANQSQKFRIQKFLNEVPIYSRDKRGTNITILILQILFMLEKGDFTKIFSRIEALKMYHRRYLRRTDTLRSNCFITMLLLLTDTNFHRERMVHRAKPYLKKMMDKPISDADQSTELEIIPYPVLWEYILDAIS